MEATSINIKSDKIFPFHVLCLGVIFSFFGALTIIESPLFGPLLIVVGFAILSGYRGIEFSRTEKKYRVYYSLFFLLKFGSWKTYDSVEKIYINSAKVSQKVYTMVTTGFTVRNLEYNSYIKFNDGTKIYLLCREDKPLLQEKLIKVAEFFKLEIIDNTN